MPHNRIEVEAAHEKKTVTRRYLSAVGSTNSISEKTEGASGWAPLFRHIVSAERVKKPRRHTNTMSIGLGSNLHVRRRLVFVLVGTSSNFMRCYRGWLIITSTQIRCTWKSCRTWAVSPWRIQVI